MSEKSYPAAGLRRVRELIRRGLGHAGPDRDALQLIGKSALAATIAWVLASIVLGAPSATFAPFSALLMVQATVSRSMDQALRYAASVIAGVVLAGLLAPLLGPAVWTFAVLMTVSLIFGRWRRLGAQGPQVAVAALFAYASFTQSGGSGSSYVQIGSIAGLVVLGCTVGVVVNLAILPPLRYRNAAYAIGGLTQSMCDLLSDMAEGLQEGHPNADEADSWRDRAAQLPEVVSQTRESVEHAAETLRYNPRRLLMRQGTSFAGHRTVINVLDRATEQLRSISRGVRYATDTEEPTEGQERFLVNYAELLNAVAGSTRELGQMHNIRDVRENDEFDEKVRTGRDRFDRLTQHAESERLDSPGQWPTYAALQTDAHRLVEEYVQAQRELGELAK